MGWKRFVDTKERQLFRVLEHFPPALSVFSERHI